MNDQDDDKKNINQDSTEGNSENQPLVDETSQSESVKISSDDNLKNENQNVDQNNDQTNVFEASNEKKMKIKTLSLKIMTQTHRVLTKIKAQML